jgi:hypothetical protein
VKTGPQAANIALYGRLISQSELDPPRDEDRHKMRMSLLAEDMVKDNERPDVRSRGLLCPPQLKEKWIAKSLPGEFCSCRERRAGREQKLCERAIHGLTALD